MCLLHLTSLFTSFFSVSSLLLPVIADFNFSPSFSLFYVLASTPLPCVEFLELRFFPLPLHYHPLISPALEFFLPTKERRGVEGEFFFFPLDMLRSFSRLLAGVAPLITTPLPTMREVSDALTIQTLLGGRNQRFGSVQSFSNVLEKHHNLKSARVGRAMTFIQRGDEGHALTDLNAVLVNAAAKMDPLDQLALALRARVYLEMLQGERDNLLVTGAGDEAKISELTGRLVADFKALDATRPGCWAHKLMVGEFNLMCGASGTPTAFADALKSFKDAVSLLESEIAQRKKLHQNPPAVTGATLEAAVAYRMQRVLFAAKMDVASVKDPEIAQTILRFKDDPTLSGDLQELRMKFNAADLSDEEVSHIAAVVSCAHGAHHFFELFPAVDNYKHWTSAEAQQLLQRLRSFMVPPEGIQPAIKATIEAIGAPKTTWKSDEEISTALKNVPKEKHVLDYLDETLGVCPPVENKEYKAAMEAFESFFASHPTATAVAEDKYLQYQDDFISSLLQQVMFRCKVGMALSLEALGKLEDAVDILDSVIGHDTYIDMWKALLARGRVLRALGRVDGSEADFKALFELRRQQPGWDLPLADANRSRSAF